MLIYHKDIDPVYFIHIPRTGGRYLIELFIKNKYTVSNFLFKEHYQNKEIPHLHYPYYNKFTNNGKIKQFCIVRNPLDRFISMFCASLIKDKLNIDKDKILNDKFFLFEFIENNINNFNYGTNWFLPQHFFLNHNCKIWKLEDGLDKHFYKWIKVNFGINFKHGLNIEKNNYTCEYDFYKKIKLNKKTISYIKEFYKHDYKLLGYK